MKQSRKIESTAASVFGGLLAEHGFAKAQILRDELRSRVEFMRNDIAVEIELDWHDFMAFVLIVHVQNGHLPEGYYAANGRKCRKHLARVIQEQGWETPPGPRVDQGQPRPKETTDMERVLFQYKGQLAACIGRLSEVGASVFEAGSQRRSEGDGEDVTEV
jgi:hypothetical protein